MRRPRRIPLFFSVFLLFLVCLDGVGGRPVGAAEPDDVARFLAGMQRASGSPIAALTRDPAWRRHASEMRSAWRAIDGRQLRKIRAWSASKLRRRRATMFYMFGGPDFAHADAFFPHASTYVLSGLEPVGRLPAVAPLEGAGLAEALADLRASFSNFRKFGYFITAEMGAQFASGSFTGTLPILYVLLARTGKTIERVEFVGLGGNGRAVALRGSHGSAVRITFSDPDRRRKTLYYFRTNLADAGVAQSGFLAFCARLGEGVSLVKSASYLMHMSSFSRVRRFLLEHSATLVQDDTGVPFRYFKPARWRLRAFGQYLGPTDQFKHAYQADLAAFFKSSGPQPVRFGIGYRWHPRRTNILVAEKRGAAE